MNWIVLYHSEKRPQSNVWPYGRSESKLADITDIESIANPSYEKLLKQFEEFKNQQMEFNKTLTSGAIRKTALMNEILSY